MVRQHLRAGETAVDVGACRGEITAVMVDCVGERGHVIAVEPDERGSAKLSERLPSVELFHASAWSDEGFRTLYRNAQPDQSALFHDAVRDWTEKEQIRTVTLDQVVDGRPIALVKIDAQGAEPEILRGAVHLLQQCPVWIVEVWPQGLTQAKSSPLALYEQLREAGLTARWADDQIVQRADTMDFRDKPTFVNWLCTR